MLPPWIVWRNRALLSSADPFICENVKIVFNRTFQGDELMITITEMATQELNDYFADKDPSPIRIFYNAGG